MSDAGTGDRVAAVERFAAWLAELSPYYRELRSEVWVHDDAPALLAAFWRTVGWAPGIGFGWCDDSWRPERVMGRQAADRAFRRWLSKECFASAMGLPAATRQTLWNQLPPRCWVQYIGGPAIHCHGGWLYYVDEDAGDDPPMTIWNTADASHTDGPVPPRVISASGVEHLISCTIATLPGAGARLPAPPSPGPFAPVYPLLWELGPGVWGKPGSITGPADPTRIGTVIAQSPRAYLDHLVSLPADLLPSYDLHIEGMHQIMVEDAKALAPRKLADRGFSYAEWEGGFSAAGRLDGIAFTVERHVRDGRPIGDSCVVLPEDYAAFRALLKHEKIRVYQHLRPVRPTMSREPTAAERARVARLAEQATLAVDRTLATGQTAARSKPRRTRRVTPVPAADPAEEATVRAEAASLRAWLLVAYPGLELTPPDLAADEPPLVRALWQELGYSEELRDVIGWPDRASSRDQLAQVLQDYRSWESPLRRSSLPRRFRLVGVDSQGCGLALTDEDAPADDPPVLSAGADTGEVSRWHTSYLTWVGEQLAEHACGAQPNCTVVTDPPLASLGERPFPRLAPGVRQLTADIRVRLERDRATVCAPRFGDLIAWLAETIIVERLTLGNGYNAANQAARMMLTRFTPPAGLRTWQAPRGDARCHVGTVEGVPLLVYVADTITLYTPHTSREAAAALATAAGWT